MRCRSNAAVGLALLVASFVLGGAATADTVYLKNGRAIDSSYVRIEGDRVVVRQYAGLVAFPMGLVDRIEENDNVEPAGISNQRTPDDVVLDEDPNAGGGGEPAQDVDDTPDAADQAAADPADPAAADPNDPDAQPQIPPEQTRQYWQDRLRPIFQQMDRVEAELAVFRARSGADSQLQADRIQDRLDRLQQQYDAIQREARRLGVPPGWLRR